MEELKVDRWYQTFGYWSDKKISKTEMLFALGRQRASDVASVRDPKDAAPGLATPHSR